MTTFELTSTRTEVVRRYELTDAPLVKVSRFEMQPYRAVVSVVDGSFSSLKLSGWEWRDGDETNQPATHTYYAQWGDAQDVPEWARPLIEGETP